MKHYPTDYTVWFWIKDFGFTSETVKAVDVVEAIELVKAPKVEKYGDDFEWLVHRVQPGKEAR